MTSGPGIERRVTRLENDRDALYELVAELRTDLTDFRGEFSEFQTEVRDEFREFRAEFSEFQTEVRDEFTALRTEFTGRFEGIEATLAEVVRRLPEPT